MILQKIKLQIIVIGSSTSSALIIEVNFVPVSSYLTLPRRTKILFALAGMVYLGGGLFLEIVEGWVFSNQAHRQGLLQGVIGALQESMEIAGIVIFIHALLKYLVENSPRRTYTLKTEIDN